MEELDQRRISAAYAQLAREMRATPIDVVDIVQLAAYVDGLGPVGFLVKPLWPADAYGVLGAEDKAGKTWMATDLGVSVATGTPFLGRFDVDASGAVVIYCGEGGARNIVRRVRAVVASKGVPFDSLAGQLRVSERAPQIADQSALERVLTDLIEHAGTRLVVIDPLYLAAAGADGSNLYKMGEALTGIQTVCQAAGAALTVTTHWNKTGTGRGAKRFTGVGPGAWGRVLGSGEVLPSSRSVAGRSEVDIAWEFTGSEIPATSFQVHREVWADDPDELSSPLHYTVEVVDGYALMGQRPPSEARVLEALTQRAGEKHTRAQIEELTGLKRRAVAEALVALRASDLIWADTAPGRTGLYWADLPPHPDGQLPLETG
jgi:hypothetical protein